MTFQTFQIIVKKYRPELEVSQHGDFQSPKNKTAYTLGIIYPNGKVYSYSGSYQMVLTKLNINVYPMSQAEYNNRLDQLNKLISEHGTTKQGFFGETTIDNSGYIADMQSIIDKAHII